MRLVKREASVIGRSQGSSNPSIIESDTNSLALRTRIACGGWEPGPIYHTVSSREIECHKNTHIFSREWHKKIKVVSKSQNKVKIKFLYRRALAWKHHT